MGRAWSLHYIAEGIVLKRLPDAGAGWAGRRAGLFGGGITVGPLWGLLRRAD